MNGTPTRVKGGPQDMGRTKGDNSEQKMDDQTRQFADVKGVALKSEQKTLNLSQREGGSVSGPTEYIGGRTNVISSVQLVDALREFARRKALGPGRR